MKRKSPGPPAIYAESLKITIAREYLTGEQSYGQLAKKYSLNTGAVVRSMILWYKRHYSLDQLPVVNKESYEPSSKSVGGSSDLTGTANTANDKQLKEALLKVEALELLIANAQKELGIDLVKKPGTKQPGK